MPLVDLDGTNILRTTVDSEGVPSIQLMSPAQAGDNPWPAETFTLYGLEGIAALYDSLTDLLASVARNTPLPPTDPNKVPL